MTKYIFDVTSFSSYSKNEPKQIIILCHGYGGDGQDISTLAVNWRRFLPDAVFLCPNAPEVCAVNPLGYQWFDMTEESNERHRATLDLKDFPKWQIQFEFIYFWLRCFKGHWSADKIFLKMLRAFLLRFTNLSALARYLIVNNRFCKYIFKTYMEGPKKVTGKKEESIGTLASYHTGEL